MAKASMHCIRESVQKTFKSSNILEINNEIAEQKHFFPEPNLDISILERHIDLAIKEFNNE